MFYEYVVTMSKCQRNMLVNKVGIDTDTGALVLGGKEAKSRNEKYCICAPQSMQRAQLNSIIYGKPDDPPDENNQLLRDIISLAGEKICNVCLEYKNTFDKRILYPTATLYANKTIKDVDGITGIILALIGGADITSANPGIWYEKRYLYNEGFDVNSIPLRNVKEIPSNIGPVEHPRIVVEEHKKLTIKDFGDGQIMGVREKTIEYKPSLSVSLMHPWTAVRNYAFANCEDKLVALEIPDEIEAKREYFNNLPSIKDCSVEQKFYEMTHGVKGMLNVAEIFLKENQIKIKAVYFGGTPTCKLYDGTKVISPRDVVLKLKSKGDPIYIKGSSESAVILSLTHDVVASLWYF